MFKRLFGKPDEELSGLSMGRFVESQPLESSTPPPDEPLQLPSRKPPPNVNDLVLPETLAEEATHPRQVDLRQVLAAPGGKAAASPGELTDAQMEAIAQRVADKLASGVVVARIVSETSERLVREEIARIRYEAERD